MPGLNLISGPGDQATPTQMFVNDLITGMKLPTQLQSQQLNNQMMQNQLQFQQQMQPLQLQSAQMQMDLQRMENPVHLALLQTEADKNRAAVKMYSQQTASMQTGDERQDALTRASVAQSAAQTATMNTDRWVQLATLPMKVAQNIANLGATVAGTQQTQQQTQALQASIALQAKQADMAHQQFMSKQVSDVLNEADVIQRTNPGLLPAFVQSNPIAQQMFPQGAPAYQPQTMNEAIQRSGVGMFQNAPASAQAKIVGRAAGVVTPAGLMSQNMLGTTDPVEDGLASGAKAVQDQQAAQSLGKSFSSNAASQNKGKGQQQQTSMDDIPNFVADAGVAQNTYGSTDQFIQNAGKFAHTPLGQAGDKGQAVLDKSPKATAIADGIPPNTEAEGSFAASEQTPASKAGIPQVDQQLYLWANQNVDQNATPAQNILWKTVVNQMYSAQAAGKDPSAVVKEFAKRYKAGALTAEQFKVLTQMGDKLGN